MIRETEASRDPRAEDLIATANRQEQEKEISIAQRGAVLQNSRSLTATDIQLPAKNSYMSFQRALLFLL
jgi:hypothetical protein